MVSISVLAEPESDVSLAVLLALMLAKRTHPGVAESHIVPSVPHNDAGRLNTGALVACCWLWRAESEACDVWYVHGVLMIAETGQRS